MSRLGELLDQLELYDYTDAKGDPLTEGSAYVEMRQIATSMDTVLADRPVGRNASTLVSERAGEDGNVPAPPWASAHVVLTVLHDVPGIKYPLTIAWDTCYRCHLHVKHCRCVGGPTEPPSVRDWRIASGHVPDAEKPFDPRKPQPAETKQHVELPPTVVDRFDRQDPEPAAALGESTETAPSQVELPEGVCRSCGITVTSENGDQNDDGSWTCFSCQGQEG